MNLESLPSSSCQNQVALPNSPLPFPMYKILSVPRSHLTSYFYIRSKAQFIKNVNLNSECIPLFARSSSLRKVLKNCHRVKFDNTCKKIPYQIINSTKNSKGYSLDANRDSLIDGSKFFSKLIERSFPKRVEEVKLNGIYSYFENSKIRRIFHFLKEKTSLKRLFLKIHLDLDFGTTKALAMTLSHLQNLQAISLDLSKPLKEDQRFGTFEALGSNLSLLSNLQKFCLQCYVDKSNTEDIETMLSKFTKLENLKTIELFIQAGDYLPRNFFSNLGEKIVQLRYLNQVLLLLDTLPNQVIGTEFFACFGKIRNLEAFSLNFAKMNINIQESHVLCNQLHEMYRLKYFNLTSNGRAVQFPLEHYQSLNQTLRRLVNLKHFFLDMKGVEATNFSTMFSNLPHLPYLKSFGLNLALNSLDSHHLGPLLEFLRKNNTISSLKLKINENDSDHHTYAVPSDPLRILAGCLQELGNIEELELTMGIIEDSILERIAKIVENLDLGSLNLVASFQNISYEALCGFCRCILSKIGKIRNVSVVPRCYPDELCELMDEVAFEINNYAIPRWISSK